MNGAGPLIVMNLAGLSRGMLDSGACPNLSAFAKERCLRRMLPVLPAVTLSMQATLITGQKPTRHGIVGNGFYDRVFMEHRFWCASAGLLDAPPFWCAEPGRGYRIGALFWWNCLGAGLDVYLNVAPMHLADGKTVSSCYSDPPGLYPSLEERFGPFPLHRFWGPVVSLESSEWILNATLHTAQTLKPDILLTYLPHLDYAQQHFGPDSQRAKQDLADLDTLLGPVLTRAREGDFELIILSEYGIVPVERCVHLNRILCEEGLFRVRSVKGLDYPDLPGSAAFAICDHQIAHVYAREDRDVERVARLLGDVDGVGKILDAGGKAKAGLHHARSGDLVILAAPDAWFAYSWWSDPGRAPEYAFSVDIHRKIGYDPLELIFDPVGKRIASDTSLIRGSHGLIPGKGSAHPVVILPLNLLEKEVTEPVSACEVKDLLLEGLARSGRND